MRGSRIALVLLLAATGGFVAWAAFRGDGPVTPGPAPAGNGSNSGGTGAAPSAGGGSVPGAAPGETSFSHPSQCASCHAAVYEEWTASMHSHAWTDPEVRALSDDFKSTECLSCHAPQPIHGAPLGGRVFERSSRFETGVDCLSCHLLPDGGVAASRDVPGAPCRPRKVAEMPEPVSCKGCHNQHGLVDEHDTLFRNPDPSKGALLREGRPETCVSCHLPAVERGAARGFDHTMRGGHHEEVLRSGMEFRAREEKGEIVADTIVANVGHRAPADSRHRSFNVWITVTTEGGVKVHDRAEMAEYRMYYRSPPRENTNLRPGETATSRFPLPRGVKGTARVELVYCMNPVKKEKREGRTVHVVEIPFDTTR